MSFITSFFRKIGRYERNTNNSENKYVTETENVFPASLLRNRNQTKKNKSFIFDGAYGAVFRNYSNPKKVIKVYKRKTNTNKEHNRANKVFKITKNNRQKVQIVQDLQYNDLPNNIKNRFSGLHNMNPISAIRMNDLGVDLHTCIEDHFQELVEIPNIIPIILEQFYRLIWQIKQLNDHRICHRDIKWENIMIDLETGIMTLIDFDLLDSFDENILAMAKVSAVHCIRHGNKFNEMVPPEWLIIGDIIRDTTDVSIPSPILANTDHVGKVINKFITNHELTEEDSKVMSSIDKLSSLYSSNIIMAYYGVTSAISNSNIPIKIPNKIPIEIPIEIRHKAAIMALINNTPKLMKAINDILVMLGRKSIPYKKVSESISTDELMSKFDIFGLGSVFSYVLSKLMQHLDVTDTKHPLHLAFELAKKMCDYDITKRVTPTEALAEMTGILKRTRISPPVFGGRRQTRRR
jgi:serine/threonine protein kinase